MRTEQERQAAELALQQLERDGRLTPEDVLNAAEDPSSPLHGWFDWNDDTAAHKYRLEQARMLIRTITVEITTENRVLKCVRYVRDPKSAGDEQGYVSLPELRRSPDEAAALLVYELERAESILGRAELLVEVLAREAETDPTIQPRLGRLRRGVTKLAKKVRTETQPTA
jgi:hypothetical protein